MTETGIRERAWDRGCRERERDVVEEFEKKIGKERDFTIFFKLLINIVINTNNILDDELSHQ